MVERKSWGRCNRFARLGAKHEHQIGRVPDRYDAEGEETGQIERTMTCQDGGQYMAPIISVRGSQLRVGIRRANMSVTHEDLTDAGASPDLARLPVRELRRNKHRNDLAESLLVATCIVFLGTLVGLLDRLLISVTSLRTDVALLEMDQTWIEAAAKCSGGALFVHKMRTV